MAQTLTIDASALSGDGFNSRTYFASYFAGLDSAEQDFFGGTPDSAFGGTYYMNGSEVVARYSDESGVTETTVIMEGEEIAYDYIHHGSTFGHGITGALDGLVFGNWIDGETEGTQGTGDAGRITGFDAEVVMDGFDLSADPGAGNDAATNPVYAVYSALGAMDADALNDLVSTYALDVTGSDAADKLRGYDFADTLSGAAGDDILRGHKGDDTLTGGEGNDLLAGGFGTDTLDGGAGDDILNGGRGRDTLTGGEGSDTFLIKTKANLEIVTDFTIGEDLIDVTDFGMTSLSDFDIKETDDWVQISTDGLRLRLMGLDASDVTDDLFSF